MKPLTLTTTQVPPQRAFMNENDTERDGNQSIQDGMILVESYLESIDMDGLIRVDVMQIQYRMHRGSPGTTR
jgi:hypothetical protein